MDFFRELTYRELAEQINNMTDEQKDSDVTIYVHGVDEFYATIASVKFSDKTNDDILDEGHPYLSI